VAGDDIMTWCLDPRKSAPRISRFDRLCRACNVDYANPNESTPLLRAMPSWRVVGGACAFALTGGLPAGFELERVAAT